MGFNTVIQARRQRPAGVRSLLRSRCAAVAVYALLAFWATWPLARAPLTTIPLGTSRVTTVPLFNLWTIWWNSDRLRHGFTDYWDAPIFHPAFDTFAFSEPQPTTIAVAPIIWITGSRGLAFNVYLWGSLVLNGVFAGRLLRLLGAGRLVALGAGAAMVLLPIVHWQLDVLQLAPLWGILWTWTALVAAARRPSLWRGAAAGGAFAVAFWTCSHQGLLLVVLLAAAVWTLPRKWLAPRIWLAGLASVAVAAVLVFPIVTRLQHVIAKHDFVRTPGVVAQLSAKPGDYTAVPGRQFIEFGGFGARPFWRLSPGWIKLLLAAAGAAFGLSRRRWRRWTAFLLVTAVLAFLLSLGTNLRIGTWEPWWTLTKYCRGFSQVRNVFRFAFFVQMAVVLLAAQALHGLFLVNRRFGAVRWRHRLFAAVLSLVGLAAVVETLPEPTNVTTLPDASANAGWIGFVRAKTPHGRGIACLPFATADNVESYEVTVRWMYFGTFHKVPLVNGYSGFFPLEHFEIRNAVNAALLTEATLQRLADARADFLVVQRTEESVAIPERGTFGRMRIERVFEDPVGVDVFRLQAVDGQ